jgi:hypothetical protein
MATTAGWLTTRKPEAALGDAIRGGTLVAQLNDVPSHNRRYRATLEPRLAGRATSIDWRLRVEPASGALSSRPSIVMKSWMPEQQGVAGNEPVAVYSGGGAFRIEGLRFGEPGWWNVSVIITDAGVTDSLGFNVIVP